MARADEERDSEYAACAADPAYFTDRYGVIDDAQGLGGAGGTMPFRLWPAQARVMWQLLAHRLIVILKARQLGISWMCCAYALWHCLFHPGKVVLLFSQGEDEAAELLRRIKALYDRLPDWMREALPGLTQDNTQTLLWANGSRVRSLPATKKAGRSFTASLVIMDEAAHMLFASWLYAALKPTIDGGGQLIVLSTGNGLGGLFHGLWQGAEAAINGFLAIFLPWWARPGRDAAWYAAQVREAVDKRLVKQEYPATPLEAFLSTGYPYFDREYLYALLQELRKPQNAPLMVLEGAESGLSARLEIYEEPVPGGEYLVTADPAEGLDTDGDHDDAAGDVWNVRTWAQCAHYQGKAEPGDFARDLAYMGEWYNGAEILVERNNHGHAVHVGLKERKHPYTRVYHHATHVAGEEGDGRLGWLCSNPLKAEANDDLADIVNALAQGLPGLIFRSPDTVSQMLTFVKLPGGKSGGEGSAHDDAVSSARMAAWRLKRRWPLHWEDRSPGPEQERDRRYG